MSDCRYAVNTSISGWILFRGAAHETLPEDAASRAIAKALHMAESFRAGLLPFDPLWKPR